MKRKLTKVFFALTIFFVTLIYVANRPAEKISADNTKESRFGLIGNTIDTATQTYAYWDKIALPWQGVEVSPHEYSFAKIDSELSKKGPIHLVGLLEANAPAHLACRRFVGLGGSCPITNINDYAEYVAKTVEHYKGRIEVWQIEDGVYSGAHFGGSLDDYAALLNTATTVIKHIDPLARVMVASNTLALTNQEYFDWLVQVDTVYDVIDLHVNGPWEDIATEMGNLRKELQDRKINKPVWVTELRGEQNNYQDLIKKHIVLLSQGVEKIFWYDKLSDTSTKSYRLLASLLYSYSISSLINPSYQLNGGAFGIGPSKYLLVAWSKTPKSIDIVKEFGKDAVVFDLFGRKLAISQAITITTEPIYIVTNSYKVSDQLMKTTNTEPVKIELSASKTQSIHPGEQFIVSVNISQQTQAVSDASVHIVFPPDLMRVKGLDHSHSDFRVAAHEATDNTKGVIDIQKSGSSGTEPTKRLVDLVFEALAPGRGVIEPQDAADHKNIFTTLLGNISPATSSRIEITIQ